MPSRRSRNDLVLFSSDDPQPLVNWLCERFGLQTILQSVAQFRPSGETEEAPAKRAYKKRGAKKGGRKSPKKGGARKGRARGRRAQNQSETGTEQG